MSRVTPPVTKFARAIRGISSSSRSNTFNDQSRHVNIYLGRAKGELVTLCHKRHLKSNGDKLDLVDRLTAYDLGARDFHTGLHRPVSRTHNIPLMQGFQTSAPKAAAHDTSTIDFFFFPPVPEPPPANPFAKLRVPLLPDNYFPDRSANSPHAIETSEEAVPRPEISVVASHPEYVLPTAMSEVVGNDGMDVDLGFLTSGFNGTPSSAPVAKSSKDSKQVPSELKQIWKGMVDDMFGGPGGSKNARRP